MHYGGYQLYVMDLFLLDLSKLLIFLPIFHKYTNPTCVSV